MSCGIRRWCPHHLPQVVRVGGLGLPRHVSADLSARMVWSGQRPGGLKHLRDLLLEEKRSCRISSRTRPWGRAHDASSAKQRIS